MLAAAHFFAQREVFGLAWISADLIVLDRYGTKAEFIAIGQPITDSVIAFIGSEDFIKGLQDDPDESLELPGIVIVAGPDSQDRYNLSLFWSPQQSCYLLLVARASLDAALEIELLRHVRARLMAEAEIKAKSTELARANADLENFAAIISHDLKAPMRALQYMTDDVDVALSQARIGDARAQVGWIKAQSRRMSSMLTELLEYSAIGRKARAIERTDTHALAQAVASSLRQSADFQITIEGNWPVIDTLIAPLDIVLRNLADNAIKHHDRPDGRICLACRETPHALVMTVADDGPGIAAEHRQAIFLPFRTLVSGDAAGSAGIGMGLALVERTVESVGGTIALLASAQGARGATFEVVWPKVIATRTA